MVGKNSTCSSYSEKNTQEKILTTKTKLVHRLKSFERKNNRTNRITLISEKGGMGRTVLSVLFSLEAEKEGLRVLLIDAGKTPYASMAIFNDYDKYDKFNNDKSKKFDEVIRLDDFIENTSFNNLSILPLGVYGRLFYYQLLDKKMQMIKRLNEIILRYDLVFMDTDTSPSEAKSLSLLLSDYALIPIEPGRWALDSLRRTFYSIKNANQEKEILIESGKFSKTQIAGILLNKFKISSKFERTYARILQKRFPRLLMKNYLCTDTKYSNSPVVPQKDSVMSFQITQTYRELMSNIKHANSIAIIR